jgi:hypothetical protein
MAADFTVAGSAAAGIIVESQAGIVPSGPRKTGVTQL